MEPDDLDEGLAELEEWLWAWITGMEDPPGMLRRKRLKAENYEWLPALGAIDEEDTLRRMLAAVKEMQRMRAARR